jgi:ribosome-associated heat shock protein Hsp15
VSSEGSSSRCRIDKWLWAARFAKTRTAATDLVLAGHVKVGGERVKPAREVGPGDTLEIRLGPSRRTVVVTGVAERRGPAKVAATLYEETPESREEREQLALERRLARPLGADLGARPTKQERRRLDALRRGQRRR